ncbi:hypothetical protein Syun_026301 [Stephania yunnanensis]|uniref:glycerophosphodiester phosphodiesterase n=1 Tax=Stephania yunnanensis TaxID=152371 RepID=A0AAP0HWK4_9MAGN
MIRVSLFVLLLIRLTLAQTNGSAPAQKWPTLSGGRPVVIARGGYSGLFPESSQFANQFALSTSVQDVILYCDLQLTKDGTGLCIKDIRLDNATNIAIVFPKDQKTYNINGKDVRGWFPLDFTEKQIFSNVTLSQSIYSRPSLFDEILPMSTVQDVTGLRPSKFWLNVQYGSFYKQHNLDMGAYVEKIALTRTRINYISSPEIGFLKSLNGKLNKDRTTLIFQFLDGEEVEPTTKQKYSAITKDLASIKSFASGIIVPKNYIWPVNPNQYLEAHTSLVTDAHKAGLEVYASGFANDMPGSFNYSYDPTLEYLQFVDNPDFSVDGVLTDFPSTASEAVACLAQQSKTKPSKGKALVISHNGASGVYAGCSDLAYQQAINDGADVIDCSVQMSKDGIPFCLASADLVSSTTAMTTFMTRSATIPEIQPKSGIFSFDLTWTEIQSVKPQLTTPEETGLPRNPANKNMGKLMALSEFLDYAKAKAVTGILINIENAAYLASKKGLNIVDSVEKALSNATLDKQVTQQVFIQSDDTSVLSIFKSIPSYKRVLSIKENIGDVPKQSVDEIKKYADAVDVHRPSIVASTQGFTTAFTNVVKMMHSANVSVYVSVLRNEFTSIAFDFFSDPMVELATYIAGAGVDGVITEYPATAVAYLRSPCSNLNSNVHYPILPAQPGGLLDLVPPEILPPAAAPNPSLKPADVVDPPLPPVADTTTLPPAAGPAIAPSGQASNVANVGLCVVAMVMVQLLCLGYFH